MLLFGVIAESQWNSERIVSLKPGETVSVRGYDLMLDSMMQRPGPKRQWGRFEPSQGGLNDRTRRFLAALSRAHATVFVIDVQDSIYHDLEIGLRRVAADTGGTYEKTTYFPSQATQRLARAITGYYLLSLDADRLPAGSGRVKVELRRRRGSVLVRPTSR